MVVHLLPLILLITSQKNEIAYVLEKYESAQKIKKGLSAMKNNVCVIGSFNVDIISYLPRLPSTGESLLADKFIFHPAVRDVIRH